MKSNDCVYIQKIEFNYDKVIIEKMKIYTRDENFSSDNVSHC